MKLVFLLEESSMKELLDVLLPRFLPEGIQFLTIPHSGKTDLRKSIPVKLRGWNEPDVKFVIIHDQDANDCIKLKDELRSICEKCSKDCLIRIPCQELEAWYFGDLKAVSAAFGIDLEKLNSKKKYRIPDEIQNPKEELKRLLPEYGQRDGARRIARFMDIEANSSHSFNVFIRGVMEFCGR